LLLFLWGSDQEKAIKKPLCALACPVQFFAEDKPALLNFEEQRSVFIRGGANLTGAV
jgi:hypothetical protein